MSMVWLILLGVLVVLLVWIVSIYNRLISLRNQVQNAWGQIDVQLQRRYDLIPNLVEAVKGYMTHERGTLMAVTEARNRADQARETIQKEGIPAEGSIKTLMGAETALRGALGNLFAVAENYPQLRASENMQQLQEELSSTENKVAFSRQSYNDQVQLYNTEQQQIPASFFAASFGHKPAELYTVEEAEARKGVKVKFS